MKPTHRHTVKRSCSGDAALELWICNEPAIGNFDGGLWHDHRPWSTNFSPSEDEKVLITDFKPDGTIDLQWSEVTVAAPPACIPHRDGVGRLDALTVAREGPWHLDYCQAQVAADPKIWSLMFLIRLNFGLGDHCRDDCNVAP
ncbi:MAG: hypothetical protein ACRDO1_08490 [Nocardioidaceae bacterium]